MKLHLSWIFLFILLSNFIYGQWAVGAKYGIHICEQRVFSDGEYLYSPPKRYGLELGAVMERQIDHIILGGELLYLQKGTRSSHFIFKMNYLESSLHVKYQFKIANFYLFAGAGGFAGYALSAKTKSPNNEDTYYNYISNLSHRHDLGAALSSGFNYHIKRGRIFGESRYRYSFNTYFSATSDDTLEIIEKYNTGFSFNIGYLWAFGKNYR
jgi:Outer membrane protein beta-barrel domain